jgi:hypothetical protein
MAFSMFSRAAFSVASCVAGWWKTPLAFRLEGPKFADASITRLTIP